MNAGTALFNFLDDVSAAKSGNKPSKGWKDRSYGKGDTMDLGSGAIYAFDTGKGKGKDKDRGGRNSFDYAGFQDGSSTSESNLAPSPEPSPGFTWDPSLGPPIPGLTPPPATTPPPPAPAQAPLTDAWLEALRRNQTTYGPIGSVFANPALASGSGSGTVYR